MKLQDYIKFLICVFLVTLRLVRCNILDVSINEENDQRQKRGVLDFFFGRFKSCGSCSCGRPNRLGEARFLGGEYTLSHEFPWLANILVKSQLLVSGVLINDRYVLTAASQLANAIAPEIKVSLGEYDRCTLDVSSFNTSAEAVVLYPEYNAQSHAHDLALIRLSRPIKFERRVSPVCLPNPGSTYLGQVGTLVGWSVSKSEDEIDNRTCRPRKLGLPILGYNECVKSGIAPMHLHDDSGCVGIVGGNSIVCEEVKVTFHGVLVKLLLKEFNNSSHMVAKHKHVTYILQNDAGSSLQYRSYTGVYDLVGVISDVNKCDNIPRTSVYTKVGPHLNWILQHTKDACYCPK